MRMKWLLVAAVIAAVITVQAQTAPDWTKSRAEAVKLLQDLIRIDTSNGGETKAAEYIKAIFDKEGIPSEIVAMNPTRANLVARIKGNGKKRPLLIMGHLDVVGVEKEKWTVDPFGAVIKDGYVFGRGAVDDKDNLAGAIQVMILLNRSKVALDRDVILLAEAGEEGTTSVGIEYMVNNHWAKIESEIALLEGGGLIVDSKGKLIAVEVSTTEKVPNSTTLIARGTSGHGSIPRPDNPIVHLAAAVGKVGSYQAPVRLSETTRAYFQRYAAISAPEDAFIYSHLEDPVVGAMVQEKLRLSNFTQHSMLHTSISPTIIDGGFRGNVIPGDAQATLDIRALPDEDIGEFMATLRRIINDPLVEVVPPKSAGRPKAAPSRLDGEGFLALERASKKVFPQAATIPIMLNGATDGAYLRAKGVQAYGIGALNEGRQHGNDERASIELLGKFVEFLYAAVVDLAGAKN